MSVILDRGPRYAFVGLACAAINNVLLIGLDATGLYYGVTVIVSALVMIPLSYALQLRFTYGAQPAWGAFWRYASALALNPPLSWMMLFLIHDRGGVPMLWAAPIMTALLFIWNFVASNWAIRVSRSHSSRESQ